MHAILLLAASLAGQCLTSPCQAPYVMRQAYVQKQAYAGARTGKPTTTTSITTWHRSR